MKLIFIGPQGSGKGTYASRVGPKLDVPQIAMGDLLRAARDDPKYGAQIRKHQDSGTLVPHEIVMAILKQRIEQSDAEKGFILDGFPRNMQQAQALDGMTKIDGVVNLVVPEEILLARLSTRVQCRKCAAIYNLRTLKPKKEGICDKCGGPLYQRDDDKPEAIKQRLAVFHNETAPLLEFYKKKTKVYDIECNQIDIPPEIMVAKIMKALGK
jgi:adenylate kinase